MSDTATELKAGRELDALVAEKVMGFQWDESRCPVCGWPLRLSWIEGCVKDNCSMRPAPKRRAIDPPPYSTDISAAWEVVEKIGLSVVQSEDGWYAIKPADIEHHNLPPEIRLVGKRGQTLTPSESPALAICVAALRAISAGSTKEGADK